MAGTLTNPGDHCAWWIGNLSLTDDFAGLPFRLRPWQRDRIIKPLFGTLRPDGLRQYRRCYLGLPRKQAKTQLSAGIGAYALLGEKGLDGKPKQGQEIVCAASDRDQASKLFDKVLAMIEADRTLSRMVKTHISKKRIINKRTGNVLFVVSSEGRRQHGGNPSPLLYDELHAQPDRRLYDALTSGQAARAERLILLITTAGNDRASLCYEQYKYACDVRDGIIDDPTLLPVIFEAGPDDDWTLESTWRKAMPAYGDFADPEYFREEFARARVIPSEESKFKQFFLNLWVASAMKWLNREAWDECGKVEVDAESLKGRECFGGIDLSATSDITALVLVFPEEDGSFKVLCRFWIPRDYALARDAKGQTTYAQWEADGLITFTDGNVIDYDAIFAAIVGRPESDQAEGVVGIAEEYDLRQVLIDPFNATQIALKLAAAGIPIETIRQGTYSMNAPTRATEVLIAKGQLHHGDNKVLTWMASNAVAKVDGEGLVKLSKGRSIDKIDGVVSLVMAIQAAITDAPPPEAGVVYRS